MKQPKLLQVLSTLSKAEWIGFKKYLLTQTKEQSDNYKIFQALQKSQKRLAQWDSVEKIRRKFFPKLSDKVCANLLSKVLAWLEDYLIIQEQLKDRWSSELALVKIYNSRGLFVQADQKARSLEKEIEKSNALHSAKAKILTNLYHAQYFSDNPIKYQEGTELLTKLVRQFQFHHKENGLRYLLELHNWGILKNHDYSQLKDALKNSLAGLEKSPLSIELERLYLMVCNEDPVLFEQVKQSLFEGKFKVGAEVHTIVTLYLIVFGGRMLTKAILADIEVVIGLYNYALETGVLMISGKIPIRRFNNIVSILANSQEYELVNAFIEKWYKQVASNHPESVKKIAMAQNCFFSGHYDKILELTRSVEFDEYLQKIRSLGIEAMALYVNRKSDYQQLDNHLKNFSRVLNRNKRKTSAAHYKQNVNLIKVLGLLTKKDFKRIDINLDDFDVLLYRSWFEKELSEKGDN